MRRGIDVSENNGYVDFEAVKAAGCDFVMARVSYGKGHEDSCFRDNVERAHAAGLEVGAYHYSYALTPTDARQEAIMCRNIIADSGVFLELPVFFDMEDADGYKENHGFNFDTWNVTAICREFLDNITLDCGVYASYSWLENYIDWEALGCAVWNAQWSDSDDIKGYMWQYTDKLEIGGKIFDGDILY